MNRVDVLLALLIVFALSSAAYESEEVTSPRNGARWACEKPLLVEVRSGSAVTRESCSSAAHQVFWRFSAKVCQATFDYDVALTAYWDSPSRGGRTMMLGKVECGTDFLIRGLLPGRYRIELLQEYATSDDHEWSVVEFTVGDHDFELRLAAE